MGVDDVIHIICATITDFKAATVANLVQWVFYGEVLINKLKKLPTYIYIAKFTIRGVKPHHFTLPIFTLLSTTNVII